MIDINLIINDADNVKAKLKSRGFELDIDLISKLSSQRKEIILIKEKLSEDKNKISDQFKQATTDKQREILKETSQDLELQINKNKLDLEKIQNDLTDHLLQIPNIPGRDVPVGKDEKTNSIIKTWGDKVDLGSDHTDLLTRNNLLDFESAVTIAKSRFIVMSGPIAKLHRALISLMLDVHTAENNYTEFNVPYIVNSKSLIGTGQLPKFEEDLFKLNDSDLYLIPTGEVPLTNIYRNKVLNESDAPFKLVAHTPCFRSEAGAYGKDTKGIIRQHQFEKVELVQIVSPERSQSTLEEITIHAESILEMLNIPYQRVLLSTGDLGFSSSKTIDIEAWFPGQNNYREISSCSNFEDFQARRLNIKIKSKETGKKIFAHTLNGSGLAIGRTLAALIENNYNNGTVKIPKALQKYTGFEIIEL